MKDEKSLTKVPFSSRLPKGLRDEFELTALQRGIRKIEAALEQAVRQWISGASTKDNAGSSTTVGSSNKPVPFPANATQQNPNEMLPSHLREWMGLVERAVTVKDAAWLSMLSSIKHQLEIVAKHADGEKGSDFRDRGGAQGSAGIGGTGNNLGGSTGRGGKKTG